MKRPQVNDRVTHSASREERSPQQAMLSMIALSLVVLFLMTVSCQPSRNGEAVNYGPEVSNADLNKALIGPIQDVNLNTLSVGQFVHFSTTDVLAGGKVTQVESDTGQTIVERSDTAEVTTLAVVQNKYVYGNSAPEKASTEFQLNIARDSTAVARDSTAVARDGLAAAPVPSPAPGAGTSSRLSERILQFKNDANAAPKLRLNLKNYVFQKLNENRTQAGVVPLSTAPAATIHRLRAWEAMEAAPDLVRAQPNCLGIPKCQIRVRHIQFDQVTWDKPAGTRVEFDLAMSPDVPLISGYKMTPIFEYYPGLIRSCVTLMIPVGTNGTETMLTQCSVTENFAFTATAQPTPTDSLPNR